MTDHKANCYTEDGGVNCAGHPPDPKDAEIAALKADKERLVKTEDGLRTELREWSKENAKLREALERANERYGEMLKNLAKGEV